jgi:hypothetical protein
MEKLLLHILLNKNNNGSLANVAFSTECLLAGFIQKVNEETTFVLPSDVQRFFVSPQEAGVCALIACVLGEIRR